ncbi:MAG: nucleotidyl transferase AbiEii/AbiGii toxin family protein [Nitrosospira sp.]
MPDLLHARRDFDQLLALVADEHGLDPMLVEKDYWIMHCLWGLQAQGFQFELKGGASLSKGFGVIHRFSEDIDIRIEPLDGMDVKAGRNQDKPATSLRAALTMMNCQHASASQASTAWCATRSLMTTRCAVPASD